MYVTDLQNECQVNSSPLVPLRSSSLPDFQIYTFSEPGVEYTSVVIRDNHKTNSSFPFSRSFISLTSQWLHVRHLVAVKSSRVRPQSIISVQLRT